VTRAQVPLLEFDGGPEAVLDPDTVMRVENPEAGVPEAMVMCFFADVVEGIAASGDAREVIGLMGGHRVYEWRRGDDVVGIIYPGAGAPLAAGLLEELIALGCRRAVACGGAGALVDRVLDHAVVVTSCVRDEGVSYHYLEPARTVEAGRDGVAALERAVARSDLPACSGTTWTTDGVYRETPRKVARRREEGCLTVEMEGAALAAVARFRDVPFGQLFYVWNSIAGREWVARDWDAIRAQKEQLLELAVAGLLELPQRPAR
jgi:uridine phosphorylase